MGKLKRTKTKTKELKRKTGRISKGVFLTSCIFFLTALYLVPVTPPRILTSSQHVIIENVSKQRKAQFLQQFDAEGSLCFVLFYYKSVESRKAEMERKGEDLIAKLDAQIHNEIMKVLENFWLADLYMSLPLDSPTLSNDEMERLSGTIYPNRSKQPCPKDEIQHQ
jgi:hypothetical protein